jgi:hypothetical protein
MEKRSPAGVKPIGLRRRALGPLIAGQGDAWNVDM